MAATLGRSVPLAGGASDLVLDERRARVYLPSPVQNSVQIYSIQRQAFDPAIPTDAAPLAAAISRDGRRLYVACYDASLLDVIDLDSSLVIARIALPARPQGVAVASDETVLITTTGSGAGGLANSLLLYNPAPDAPVSLQAIPVTPVAPGLVVFPPPSGRVFLAKRSQLVSSRNGASIAGVNVPAAGPATVFVYEAASRSVLRSRAIPGATTALAISDDGSRVAAGQILFDAATLQILGTHNAANISYPIDPRTPFALQVNQGGAVFTPDGLTLYQGLNIPPPNTPVGIAATSQLMLADPDNLLVRQGIQIPDTLTGRMALSANGAALYALSDSGLAIIPVGTIATSPLAVPASNTVLLTRDPCAVNPGTFAVAINNPGGGRVTPSGQLFQVAGLAGQGTPATAPSVRTTGTQLTFTYNATAGRGTGTVTPPHDFLIQAPEAVNIPDRVRVYENSRDSDARGSVIPIPTGVFAAALPGLAATSALPDIAYDQARQRLYIANAGMNRVEIYDIRQQRLLPPVKAGQLPVSLALTPDGTTLYAANYGSENITIIDPDRLQVTGRVSFPPLAFNSNLAAISPTTIAWSQSGLMILTSNGTLWKAVGESAVPRTASRLIGVTPQGGAIPLPASSMASTPAGDYILLSTLTGNAYLYDAAIDDFIAARQVSTVATPGFIGAVAAGVQGRFFIVNGILLNPALQTVRAATGLISAVATMGNNYVAFAPPPAAAPNAALAAPTLQILDATTGNPVRTASGLEGPATTIAANARAAVSGRTMAIDAQGTTAFALTASGLSVIPLTPVAAADRPLPNTRGAVNLASYQTAIAPNGLLSIFGQNMGNSEVASAAPLPVTLGGTCVTLNNIALPLFMVSPGQINAQIPPELAAGSYPLVVRSLARQAASTPQQMAVSRYAPAVLVDTVSGQIALFHADGVPVSRNNPAQRDKPITMYALGLGLTTGGRPTSGNVSPTSPLAETAEVQVFFGDPRYRQSEVIVDWSGLTPGYIGLYQLNLRVPGFHEKGDQLPVTIRIGGVDSPTSGPVVPYVSVE